jgi:predicted nucleotidyltransferase
VVSGLIHRTAHRLLDVTPARAAAAALFAAAADGRLDDLCRRYRVRVLGIFGSAARPGPAEPADVDIGVGFLDHDGPVLALLAALIDLLDCDSIDLAMLDGAEPLLRARAFAGIGLYEHEAGMWATEQMAALAEARDTAWLRRLDLAALAEGR